jgi:hypothetical protein
MKHVIKRFSIKRDLNIYPDTDLGHAKLWDCVLSEAERVQYEIEQRDCIVCEWEDFPIFEHNLIVEWVIEIQELPQKKKLLLGLCCFTKIR